ncbi:MAG: succinate-semialdehyde dehydrogenase (NADP(+)) [Gammaproteobacteria bacterium]|nr:MAG: succinate-semialdehyde dehydrogenase (NADP(+)) [Gammaproteobacteria bacterium]
MHLIKNKNLILNSSFVNGEWLVSDSTFEVFNPATGKAIAQISEVTSLEVENAINSAAKAFEEWKLTSYQQRSDILLKWQKLLREHSQDLARILTSEQGKPLSEAVGEILHSADYIKIYAEQAHLFIEPINQDAPLNQQAKIYRKSIGVVTAITPWNFPCSMVARKAGAALAAGCSFVLKPSELTPLSALALAKLGEQAGIPAGVFNVVVGSNAQAIGEIFTSHPKIAKFSFTGSTIVGKRLLAQCANGVKRTAMELGGNAPFIVFEDADIDEAVEGAWVAKFRNSGQTCVTANRFIIHKNIKQEFVKKLIEKIKQLKMGCGFDSENSLGPLVNQRAIDKISGLVNKAKEEGANILLGGHSFEKDDCKKGTFFEATVIDNVTPQMEIFHKEIFGPVVTLIEFKCEEEAIRLANQTESGLCAYAYTKNEKIISVLNQQLNVGMLGINTARLSNPSAPFGGVKQSGMGREGGSYGIEEYLDYQYVCIR